MALSTILCYIRTRLKKHMIVVYVHPSSRIHRALSIKYFRKRRRYKNIYFTTLGVEIFSHYLP